MNERKKEFKIGTLDRYGVFIEVTLKDTDKGTELSIVGYTQYRPGNDWEIGGQIDDFLKLNKRRIHYANGWTIAKFGKLLDIWDRWHLNGMRAECVHMRAIAMYLKQSPHAVFGIDDSCPYCGYSYGHSWLYEPLPQNVLDWFEAL